MPDPAAEKRPATTAAGLPPLAADTLVGEWRVAGIDGEELGGANGIALTADEAEIWWEPRCAHAILRYRIGGSAFEIIPPPPPTPPPAPSPTPPLTPGGTSLPAPVICTIGLPPRLADVMNALRAGRQIERTAENGIRISGDDSSITLFSQ